MRVEVTASGNATSTACVSAATFLALHAVWGCYVMLKCCEQHCSRVFRLEIDENMKDNGAKIQIDHWPTCSDDVSDSCSGYNDVNVQVLSPSDVCVVQYVALAPVGTEPMKLALPFIKRLLRGRVLTGRKGIVTLALDGLEYGSWTYRAYFRGHSSGKAVAFDSGVVTDQTLIALYPSATSLSPSSTPTYQPMGSHARTFRSLVAMALRHTSIPSRDAATQTMAAPPSLLLHAPSGAGKTTLVHQVADEMDANLLVLDSELVASRQLRIEDFFSAALRIQPCVVLMEDVELLFPMTLDEAKYQLVCRFINCLKSIYTADEVRVAVIGTVSDLHILHAKVRQVFTEEVRLDVPDQMWSFTLFKSLLPSSEHLRPKFLMSLVVRYGQNPSHLVFLAQQICLRLASNGSQDESLETLESDIAASARQVASIRNGADALRSHVPSVSWDDIGGLDRVKQSLMEMVVWPLEKPHVFRRMGISPPLGMMLHGPPGTGKTILAKATANACGCNFLNLSASDVMKAEMGESEKAITRVFDTARALSPCLIFIDEFQALFGNRTTAGQTTARMISQLLMELDALKAVSDDCQLHDAELGSKSAGKAAAGRIFVLAATNALSAIDPAFLQPGRFENVVYVGLPSAHERKAILDIQRKKMPWSQDVDLDQLVEETDGANPASIVALCQSAAIQAMQRIPYNAPDDEQCIEMLDFKAALASESFDFQKSIDRQTI